MNTDTILIVLTFFVAVTAVSFVAQAVALLRMAKTAKEMKERVDVLLPKAEKLIQTAEGVVPKVEKLIQTAESVVPKAEKLINTAESLVADGRTHITEITGRAQEILALAHTQMTRVDELVSDASERAKFQMDRAETALDNTLTRVNDTVHSVQGTVMRPVRELTGVAAGLKAAVGHLLKGNPANVAQVTTDEEMFI